MCAATGDAEFKSRQLADWVEAEAQRFTNAATVCLGRISELAGQASIQILTDAGWPKDRKKCLSMSFQAVEEDWPGNLVICIDFANFVDGTAEANVDMIKAALDAIGATVAVIVATAQDMAAKKIAASTHKGTAHCGLHQNDKLMKIACGDLDPKKGRQGDKLVPVFPARQAKGINAWKVLSLSWQAGSGSAASGQDRQDLRLQREGAFVGHQGSGFSAVRALPHHEPARFRDSSSIS